ncbi:MAG TPA: hypothetical protein VD932_02750 [Aquabacterium sp.]|nr:hypothetical protein [Aquabacterium sp.]
MAVLYIAAMGYLAWRSTCKVEAPTCEVEEEAFDTDNLAPTRFDVEGGYRNWYGRN